MLRRRVTQHRHPITICAGADGLDQRHSGLTTAAVEVRCRGEPEGASFRRESGEGAVRVCPLIAAMGVCPCSVRDGQPDGHFGV